MSDLVPVKPAEGQRFGDFIQQLIVSYPAYSGRFRVSPGHTDGTGRSSVALLVPREVADDMAAPKPDDDLISDEEVPPERVAASDRPTTTRPVAPRTDDALAKSQPVTRGRRRKSSATS